MNETFAVVVVSVSVSVCERERGRDLDLLGDRERDLVRVTCSCNGRTCRTSRGRKMEQDERQGQKIEDEDTVTVDFGLWGQMSEVGTERAREEMEGKAHKESKLRKWRDRGRRERNLEYLQVFARGLNG